MRASFFVATALLLSACYGGTGVRQTPAIHDLSSAQLENSSGQPGVLRQVEVHSPSWLDTAAMQYRLSYADRTRRETYAASRWAAPPARLLQQKLRQRLLSGPLPFQADGCRLRVDLDEFVQDYYRPESSQVVIEARVTLLAPRTDTFLARQDFRLIQSAGADARSGVIALEAAVRRFADEIQHWLAQTGSETSKPCRVG